MILPKTGLRCPRSALRLSLRIRSAARRASGSSVRCQGPAASTRDAGFAPVPSATTAAAGGPVIGLEKPILFLRRKVADLNDGVDVLGRDRRLIGRVGDLRDEAAVLPSASARRWRMPDGRLSSTSRRIALYAAISFLRVDRSASVLMPPAPCSLDGGLDRPERAGRDRRCANPDREVLQPARGRRQGRRKGSFRARRGWHS